MRTIARLFVALLAVLALSGTAHADIPAPTVDVVAIPASEESGTSTEFLDALQAAGFTGQAGDGLDAIYVPRDVAMDLCASDLDCSYASGEQIVSSGPVYDA